MYIFVSLSYLYNIIYKIYITYTIYITIKTQTIIDIFLYQDPIMITIVINIAVTPVHAVM